MKKEKEEYFIKIENPRETRKEVLEGTRDILRILQGYEKFKEIRKQRTHLIEHFKKTAESIKAEIQEIKRMLPKANVVTKRSAIAKEELPKAPREVKKIEEELADIEAKLNVL
ncbi:hypothetical protein JXB27_03585 [Candidatus Woesearchaeota archaeon]|nr:hypothetical protein [Candidatus Woesearchaeota archaeon]